MRDRRPTNVDAIWRSPLGEVHSVRGNFRQRTSHIHRSRYRDQGLRHANWRRRRTTRILPQLREGIEHEQPL